MSVAAQLQQQAEIAMLPLADQQAMVARLQWTHLPPATERGQVGGGRADQMPPDEVWTLRDVEAGNCPEDWLGRPREDWFTWFLMAGRGSGKTRAGAEDAWWYGYQYPGIRYAIVAPTAADVVKTCFEGESGLIARLPPHLFSSFNRSEKILTLTNGTQYFGYSAEEPDRLRGPQHHRAWCDELAAWRYLDDTLDNLLMGLRLGATPRIVATSTPRPLKRIKEIAADPTTIVDTVSTYANLSNLPKVFVQKILSRYEGTRLGRQELSAEILTDDPGAMWQRPQLDALRSRPAGHGVVMRDGGALVALRRIVVAVDPASGGLGGEVTEEGDEYGIVVVGLGEDGRGYVLADLSAQYSPGEFGEATVTAYDEWHADRIIYEANQGGEHIRQTIVTSAAAMRREGKRDVDFVPTEAVWASRGKVTRAEPVSALYEQGRVAHVGTHARLEDQMCEFRADFDKKKMGYSPDRVDALVWGLTHLMLNDSAGQNIEDFYRRSHGEMVAAAQAGAKRELTLADGLVALVPPEGLSHVTGRMGHMYSLQADGTMHVQRDDAELFLAQAGWRRPEA